MGAEYVVKIVKATAVVAAVAALFCATYFSPTAALGLLAGAAWSCLNLLATGQVVRALIAVERPGKLKIVKLSFIKFPILYGAGYLLLRARVFPPVSLVSGFSLVLLVIFLKALGASVTGSFSTRHGFVSGTGRELGRGFSAGLGRPQPGNRSDARRR